MSRALPDLSRLSAHDDPATGIRERFLQPMLDGSRTVAVLTTPHLTVEQLAAQNGITYPYTIYIGQVLTI